MKIGDRIKLQRKKLGMSQHKISEILGWISGRSRISNYENNLRIPRSKDICRLAKVLKTTPQWLLFGVDEPLKSDYSNEPGWLVIRMAPLLSLEKVLSGNIISKGKEKMTVIVTSKSHKISKNAYFIEIVGDAMLDPYNISASYMSGDFALIEPDTSPNVGDAVLIKHQNSLKIRQFIKDGTQSILKALNPNYPLIKLTPAIEILGVITITQRNRVKK